jgi:hypothetical protein
MKSVHLHPKPLLDRVTQYGAAALIVVMLVATVAQIALAMLGGPGGLFVFTGIATLLLVPPVLLLTTATPRVTVSPDGIIIQPLIWKEQLVRWDDVRAIKDYPLLPPSDSEIGRKAISGRRGYRPAEGKMLVIPGLPIQYRVTGYLAGEGFTGVIALTSRTHQEYDKLIKKVMIYYEEGLNHRDAEGTEDLG